MLLITHHVLDVGFLLCGVLNKTPDLLLRGSGFPEQVRLTHSICSKSSPKLIDVRQKQSCHRLIDINTS